MSAATDAKGCADLRALLPRALWRFEESYAAEEVSEVRGDGRWYVELVCRGGVIYPWGGQYLAASIEREDGSERRGLAGKLLALPSTQRIGGAIRFPVEALPAVAAILRPRRKAAREKINDLRAVSRPSAARKRAA